MNQFAVNPGVVFAAAEVDQVATALRAVVEASPAWLPDSIAADQIKEEAQYASSSSPYPVKHALLTGTATLGMAVDHLTALAGVMRTERTVFAERSLVRPILSASGGAYYLLDSSLSVRERLRRSWSMYAAAYTEQLAMSNRPGDEIEQRSVRRRNDIKDLAEAAGFAVHHPEWKRLVRNPARKPPPWKIGEKAYPGEGELLIDPLLKYADRSFGWSLFRMTSMFVHAQPTAVTSMLLESSATSEAGVANASIGTTLGRTLLFVGAAALSLRATAIAALETCGRDTTWWTESLAPILLRWWKIVETEVEPGQYPAFDVQPGEFARAVGFLMPRSP